MHLRNALHLTCTSPAPHCTPGAPLKMRDVTRYAGRAASASPATGLAKRHVAEQGALVADALGHSVRQEIRRQKKG